MERLLYNCAEGKGNIPSGVVYIGRGSVWGNPFVIGKDGTRDEVIEKFRQELKHRLRTGEVTVEALAALYGKPLLCHCHPLPCHGDILIRASEWAFNKLQPNRGNQ